MHFQFLIEDQSSAELIKIIMDKYLDIYPYNTYDYKAFKGIGGFTKKNTIKETKTGKLLNDLMTYMRGFQRSLNGIDAVIFVVLDNDNNDPVSFMNKLNEVSIRNLIIMDHVFCIAIEEVEAWLLGDSNAIFHAYPDAKHGALNEYVQDSICGTWEVLADVVYKGGYKKLKSKNLTFQDIGKLKSEWARNIGLYMDIHNNKSPSFNEFISAIETRICYEK